MTIKPSSTFLFFTLLSLVACGPVTTIPQKSTACAPEDRPCPDEQMTLTAAMETQWASTPGFTPQPFATITLMVGDLGWGKVDGKIFDGNTGLPLADALVTCEHSSYTSPFRCHGTIGTTVDGYYSFGEQFFHDTDRIILRVEKPGYEPLRFEQSFLTQPGLHKDLYLFPAAGDTLAPTPSDLTPPTPFLMCTAPACPGGRLVCGKSDGCLGGCGTICLTATP